MVLIIFREENNIYIFLKDARNESKVSIYKDNNVAYYCGEHMENIMRHKACFTRYSSYKVSLNSSFPQNQTYWSNPFDFGQLITHNYIVVVGKNECLYQLIRQRIRTNSGQCGRHQCLSLSNILKLTTFGGLIDLIMMSYANTFNLEITLELLFVAIDKFTKFMDSYFRFRVELFFN